MAGRINVCRDCSLISLRPVARSVAGSISLILVRDLHLLYFLRPPHTGIGTLRTRLARGPVIRARGMCRKSLGKQPSQNTGDITRIGLYLYRARQ